VNGIHEVSGSIPLGSTNEISILAQKSFSQLASSCRFAGRTRQEFRMAQPSLPVEEVFLRLTNLLSEMPEFMTPGAVSTEMHKWFARAVAVLNASGDTLAGSELAAIVKIFPQDLMMREYSVQQVVSLLHIALAKAELIVPQAMSGAFIAAGSSYDAYAAVAKVLTTANSDLLLVDPYSSEAVLSYALAAPENVSIRILADQAGVKPGLKPAAQAWAQQYGAARPLEVRLAIKNTMHDRLILVDGKTVWLLGQSFNKLADRAHTSISRVDADLANLKLAAYATMWGAASPL
jgi:hypothetical protein